MVIMRQRLRWHRKAALPPLLIASLLLLAACGVTTSGTLSGQSHAIPTATLPAKWHGVNPGLGMPTVTPLASLAPRPLPAFSDPRVAYIGPDSLLHVVSLDGKTDVAGTPIPMTGFPMVNGVWAAGTSPDGKHLAYYEDALITTIDAASGVRKTAMTSNSGDSDVSWSPDQRYLALRYVGAVECVNVATGGAFVTPRDTLASGAGPMMDGPFGWIDATHVAMVSFPDRSGTPGTHGLATPAPSAQTQMTLVSLDVTTNQVRTIATLQGYGYLGRFSVLPGSRWTLVVNTPDNQQPIMPFIPLAALINNSTGAVIHLPHLTSLLPQSNFYEMLWRPNSTQAIVAGEFGQGRSPYLLIDALRDTATPLALPGVPEAWSPDGSTLVVATNMQSITAGGYGWTDTGVVGDGPFTLIAVRVGADGVVSPGVTLTTRAMSIPLLGFVHTT